MGIFYRATTSSLKLFNQKLETTLDIIQREKKYSYIMGDFNVNCIEAGACPRAPPSLEIEKQKIKKRVIRANFKLFQLYFATFLVKNITFSAIF